MLLSIVIPANNVAKTIPTLLPALRGALRSIACDYELLFVDAGSTDGTPVPVTAAAARDPEEVTRLRETVLRVRFLPEPGAPQKFWDDFKATARRRIASEVPPRRPP
jgi:glycosyltransferase involved in cell wall biosynthesis